MAKKSRKKTESKKSEQDNKVSNDIRHLEVLLKFSLEAVDGRSESLDKLFQDQSNKIQKEIDELKEKQ